MGIGAVSIKAHAFTADGQTWSEPQAGVVSLSEVRGTISGFCFRKFSP